MAKQRSKEACREIGIENRHFTVTRRDRTDEVIFKDGKPTHPFAKKDEDEKDRKK